jgi:hypothetical protein
MSSILLQLFTNGARHAYPDTAGTWIRESRLLALSLGIGAVYADRFARQRHDLVWVACGRARKEWSTNVED